MKITATTLMLFAAQIILAQTWTGATSDRWDVGTNWSTNAVPADNGAVVIPGTLLAGRPWPRLVANTSMLRLTMQSGSQLNTGGFNMTMTATSSTGVSIAGATLTNPVAGSTTIISMTGGNMVKAINGSTFNGDFHFISTSLNQTFNEANTAPNTWNGNLIITLLSEDALNLSQSFQSTFNGNVTLNKTETVNGAFNAFGNGNVTIAGDLTINKPIGGVVRIGHGTNITQVNGRLFWNFSHNGTGSITIQNIRNNTGGGTILVKKAGTLSQITNNKFVVNSFQLDSMNGQMSLNDLTIIGSTLVTDCLGGPIYLNRNVYDGDFFMSSRGATCYDGFADADAGNLYKGNALFEQIAGNIIVGYNDTAIFERDLTFNSSTAEDLARVRFAGSQHSTISNPGGALSISRGEIIKTGDARLILGSPVSLSLNGGFTFTSGHMQSSASAPLRVNNNVSLSGSLASHVIGPIDKVGIAASSLPFTYPVGSGFTYNPLTQSSHGGNGTVDTFRAQYILQNPGGNGLNADNKAGTLSNVSKAGYWLFNRLSGVRNVNLTFRFGANPYHDFPALANLKVAQWNGSQWDDKGNGGTTGSSADGTITHTGSLSTYTYFALANQLAGKYWYDISNPGNGPDGTPVKAKGTGGWPAYQTRQLPAGVYTADSIYLVPDGSATGFKLRDVPGVEKDDTTYTLPTPPPVNYVMANAAGSVDFTGWRHFVYIRNASNEIIGALRDNGLTLGATTMQAFFAAGNTAIAPNGGQHFLKRSFKISSTLSPAGARRVRLFISKTELSNLTTADPAGLPNGINSLHIYRYTGAQEDTVFNPRPGGSTEIIAPSAITKTDLGTMWALDADVPGFSGFYLAGVPATLSICPGSNATLPAPANGATYQWQINTGSGFTNLSNNGTYSGVNTSALTISDAATSLYGSIYRCVVDGNTGLATIQLKFSTTWQGTANTLWNNPANWPCGVVPDANTDVMVKTGATNVPFVNANTAVRTLTMQTGTTVNVANGVTLTVVK